MFTKRYPLFLLITLVVFVAGCDVLIPAALPDPTSSDEPALEATYTTVAQTVIAQVTQLANTSSPAPAQSETFMIPASMTLAPSSTLFPTSTPVPPLPTYTPQPTYTPLPTYTPYPTPTLVPCHLVQFIADVTIPDGKGFVPGDIFLKTWRLKNIGSCTWNTKYELVFMSGEKMGGKSPIPLPYTVLPGQTVDVSVELTAPGNAGIYQGNWQLRTPEGKTFGIGESGNKSFWVKIAVLDFDFDHLFNFVVTACKASWSSGAGALPCPGQAGDAKGFVQFLTAPVLESGKTEDEPALWIHPQYTNDGWIQVEYPAFQVHPDDKFVAIVGCLYNNPNCKVIFSLNYRTENGTVKTLATWSEAYEGQVNNVVVDLSALAGMRVSFILRVDAWGNADADHAFWLNPHIKGLPRLDEIPFCPNCD